MKLIPISEHPDAARVLYLLLEERPAEAAISHKAMPSFEQHCAFVANHPYESWDFIVVDYEVVGAVYLTPAPRKSIRGNEIGIFIFKAYQGKGYGADAVKMVMHKHGPRRYLANISPHNERSKKMFEALGFSHCENTFEITT